MDVSRETCLKGFGKQQWPVYQDRHFVGFVLGRQGDVLPEMKVWELVGCLTPVVVSIA